MKSFKNIISVILAVTIFVGVCLSLSSCILIIPDVHDRVPGSETPDNGGSKVEPDSSLGDGNGAGADSGLDFIDNGCADTDYSNLTPESRGLLACVRIVSGFQRYVGYGQSTLSTYKKEGSGVIISVDREEGDAYILTNFHVVYHKEAISQNHISNNIGLYLYGQESDSYRIEASFVGGSLTHDLAVLKVENSEVIKHSHAQAALPASSEDIAVGDGVFAVGNPEGFGISLTEGTVNVTDETLEILGADGKTTLNLRVVRISAAINEGNSGGGLYDDSGRLIGIVCAKRTGDDVDNLAYAIPINQAMGIARIIIEDCDGSSTGFMKYQLGVTMDAGAMGVVVDEQTGKIVKVEKVTVSELLRNSPLVGLVGVGDVITSITVDGVTTEVSRIHHVTDSMLAARDGSTVTLSLVRDGISFSRSVTMNADMLVSVP